MFLPSTKQYVIMLDTNKNKNMSDSEKNPSIDPNNKKKAKVETDNKKDHDMMALYNELEKYLN